ncbi:MAG: hypothetical protein QM813_06135 [Verrucomicrobiota bacterium]
MSELQAVQLGQDNPIQYAFFLSGRILVARFSGLYRPGHSGKPDCLFIEGIAATAMDVWNCRGLVLDLSNLDYQWGDEMEWLLPIRRTCTKVNFPSATVVGPKCRNAIATLIFDDPKTTRLATEHECIFDDVGSALLYVRQQLEKSP